VKLEDGLSKLKLGRLGANGRYWQVTMAEGRNRQIRRTFAALGYTVTKLHRTQFGQYALPTAMTHGKWQLCTDL
jgi:23S rRNA pseudouridine2605 synthase